MSEQAAGWYPDPWAAGQRRFWTGTSWTGDVFPEGVTAGAPPSPAPWTGDAPGPAPTAPSAVPPQPPQWGTPGVAPPPDVVAQEPWMPAPPPPGPRRPRGMVFLALMLVAGLLIGFLGVFGVRQLLDRRTTSNPPGSAAVVPSTPRRSATPSQPSTPPQPSPAIPPGNPADPAAAALPDLVVQQSDVGASVTVGEIPNGTAVSGATTLDLCNGTFPSESLRTARLQVAAYDDSGEARLSTEAVAYRNAAATTQAFAELRSVAATCPASPVASSVGEPTVTTKILPAPDPSWPRTSGVVRQAYHFTSTDTTGTTSDSIAVYLRRGRILLALYFPQAAGKQIPVAGQSTVSGIVKAFQDRLAGIPRNAVGA